MNPTLTIALAQSHQQELRRSAAQARALSEISGPRTMPRTRLTRSIDVLRLAPWRRRPVLSLTPAPKRA
jgi:hypothetical protein